MSIYTYVYLCLSPTPAPLSGADTHRHIQLHTNDTGLIGSDSRKPLTEPGRKTKLGSSPGPNAYSVYRGESHASRRCAATRLASTVLFSTWRVGGARNRRTHHLDFPVPWRQPKPQHTPGGSKRPS